MGQTSACVLIVDKDASSRAFARTILRREGMDVEAVSNANGALKVLAARSYEVVLLDLDTPEAMRVVDYMRSNGLKMPVVAASSGDEDQEARVRKSSLVARVMPKPLEIEELIDTIRSLCPHAKKA